MTGGIIGRYNEHQSRSTERNEKKHQPAAATKIHGGPRRCCGAAGRRFRANALCRADTRSSTGHDPLAGARSGCIAAGNADSRDSDRSNRDFGADRSRGKRTRTRDDIQATA
jgi:hypothetical protein